MRERGEEESKSDYDNVDDDGDAAPMGVLVVSPVSGAAPEVRGESHLEVVTCPPSPSRWD